jgi:hypothetical protein
MDVIFVDKTHQKENGEHPGWIVQDELMGIKETFQEWLKKMREKIQTCGKCKDILGLYIYDMSPVVTTAGEPAMMIRYAYIR